jgi:hypothetical protein
MPVMTSAVLDLALQPDARIVVAGYRWIDGGPFGHQTVPCVVRLHIDGSLDVALDLRPTTADATGRFGYVAAVALQPSGGI